VLPHDLVKYITTFWLTAANVRMFLHHPTFCKWWTNNRTMSIHWKLTESWHSLQIYFYQWWEMQGNFVTNLYINIYSRSCLLVDIVQFFCGNVNGLNWYSRHKLEHRLHVHSGIAMVRHRWAIGHVPIQPSPMGLLGFAHNRVIFGEGIRCDVQ